MVASTMPMPFYMLMTFGYPSWCNTMSQGYRLVHQDEAWIYRGPWLLSRSQLHPFQLSGGVMAWAMSLSKHIQVAMNNVKDYLAKSYPGCGLPKCATAPLPINYMPKLDVTPELDADKASFYQSQIGVLHWCVELGCINIITKVSALSSHLALPHEGHLEAVFHIFAYLECWHNACIVYDPNYPNIDMSVFKQCDGKSSMVMWRKHAH